MRRIIAVLVCAAALVMEGRAAAQDGVKTLDDAWIKAVKAGDVEAVVALYAPDAVLYLPDLMEANGTAAIRKAYSDWLAQVTITDTRLNSTYLTHGDLSVGWGRFTLTMTPKSGGAPMTVEGRATAVGRRTGGKWLYVSDHASLPLPPPPASR